VRPLRLPSPSLLGAHGWRAVLPLSVKCAAFVIGATVSLEMDELGSQARSTLRRARPIPAIRGVPVLSEWTASGRAGRPSPLRTGVSSHG
jgi:hypothetical protein